jgi:hypothetical protein
VPWLGSRHFERRLLFDAIIMVCWLLLRRQLCLVNVVLVGAVVFAAGTSCCSTSLSRHIYLYVLPRQQQQPRLSNGGLPGSIDLPRKRCRLRGRRASHRNCHPRNLKFSPVR